VQPDDRRGDPANPSVERGLTRRRLLVAAGAAGAAGLLTRGAPPATALATGAPRLSTLELGSVPAGTPREVLARRPFDLVAVQWSGDPRARVAVRTRAAHGVWSAWADGSDRRHAASRGEGPAGVDGSIGEPIWTGPGDRLQVLVSPGLEQVRLHLVDGGRARGAGPAAGTAALTLAQPVLAAGPGQPPIIARAVWGQGLHPRGTTLYGAVRLAFVHHTQSQNGYASSEVPAALRSLYAFHTFVRGWKDVGYNFVIDRFGRIWEARAGGIDEPVVGAQTGGFNLLSTGVAILGSYSSVDISAPARRALADLLAWKLSLHGLPAGGRVTVQVDPLDRSTSRFPAGAYVSLPRVAGHRDADSTDCPGDALYHEMPSLRRQVKDLAGRPLRVVLQAPEGVTAPGPIALTGEVGFLDGAPLAGAIVALQARQAQGAVPLELTVAQATTDTLGQFAAAVPAGYNVSLRALYTGGVGSPAAVSDPVDVVVAPLVTLQAADAHPPAGAPAQLSGTIRPPKAQVRLRFSAVTAAGTASRLSEQVIDGSAGSFSLAVALPGPGRYRFQAATATDQRNAGAISPPVDVLAG
jgi:hypothetical protein